MKKSNNRNGADFTLNQKAPLDVPLEDIVSREGLQYSHYVIQNRALVEIYGDSLKPVQRRILYSMLTLGSTPNSKELKGVRVSGDVTGRFHPHGDSSVLEAQENMGQPFKSILPMFKIQGTLGRFTGDTAPAGRYYEIGLNPISWEVVSEALVKSTPMTLSEVGSYEPVNIPSRFPYVLVQGTSGIAVGYSSEMPSHNPDEVMDAVIAYYKGKITQPEDVLKYIKGPDFPTGGEVLGLDGVREYITNGKGSFLIRGKYTVEQLPRGKSLINIYELPYRVSVTDVKEAVYTAQDKGKLKEISSVKDLSDNKVGLSCLIELKAGSNVNQVLEDIFKYTPVQTTFSVKNTALVKGVPTENIPLLTILDGFCTFREECYRRKVEYKLNQLQVEYNKLKGLLAVLVDVDKAISIIRNAEDSEKANKDLQKAFSITSEQADGILSMRLRSLTKADKDEIVSKSGAIEQEIDEITTILSDETLVKKEIIKELQKTKKIISKPRQTDILGITNEEIQEQAKQQAKTERLLNKDVEVFLHFDGKHVYKDIEEHSNLKATSKSNIGVILSDSSIALLPVENIPLTRNKATDISTLVTSKLPVVSLITQENQKGVLLASSKGNVNIVLSPIKLEGTLVNGLEKGETIIYATPIQEVDNLSLCFVSEDGKIAKMKLSAIRQTNGPAKLIKGTQMDNIVTSMLVSYDSVIETTTKNGEVKYTLSEDCPDKGRGNQGYLLHKLLKGDSIIEVRVVPYHKGMNITSRGGRAR